MMLCEILATQSAHIPVHVLVAVVDMRGRRIANSYLSVVSCRCFREECLLVGASETHVLCTVVHGLI
jgi:hypothetical protein